MTEPAPAERTALPQWLTSRPSALDVAMGLEILEVSPQRVVGRMPVLGNTQPVGVWHGGASCVLAETLGSIGAMAAVQPDRVAYGIEINATHHLTATAGHVTGTATALRIGRTLLTYEVVLVDDDDRRICTARITCMAASPPPGFAKS